MGCASSKKQTHCKNCQTPYSRSYSVPVHHHPASHKGDSYHVVALTSSTLGSLPVDSINEIHVKNQHNDKTITPTNTISNSNRDTNDNKSEEFLTEVLLAKNWSNMIEEKIPKVIPRTPIRTPPGEPETINTWELMEGLDDCSPLRLANLDRSFSFHAISKNPIDRFGLHEDDIDSPTIGNSKPKLLENVLESPKPQSLHMGDDDDSVSHLKPHENGTESPKPQWLQENGDTESPKPQWLQENGDTESLKPHRLQVNGGTESEPSKLLQENGGAESPKPQWLQENGGTESEPSQLLQENGGAESPKPQRIQENGSTESPKPQWLQENGGTESPPPQWLQENGSELPKPQWLDDDTNSPLNPIMSDFDPEIVSQFRKALEELSPVATTHLKSPEREKTPFSGESPCFSKKLNDMITPTKCPPRGEDKVVIYFTSLRGVRKTYEDCCHVRVIFKGFGVRVDERDVSMHYGFREELKELLEEVGSSGGLPRVFVKGRYIGGAEEIRQLNEDGKLEKLVEGCAGNGDGNCFGACELCGDVRFVPCESCSGSCKIYCEDDGDEWEGEDGVGEFQRCPDCNENGIVRCPVCCD